jgi:hypothetical protein
LINNYNQKNIQWEQAIKGIWVERWHGEREGDEIYPYTHGQRQLTLQEGYSVDYQLHNDLGQNSEKKDIKRR